MKKYCSCFILLLLMNQFLLAQNPISFQLGSEEGIPNQTVYSIIQDKKGFIWLGTDAGLFKYDGIRYYQYKNKLQKSRSLTGLTQTSEGNIFAHNFSGQIFYIKNDTLNLLSSWDKGSVTNICTDKKNNLWVCHSEGIDMLSDKTNIWTSYLTKSKYSTGNFTHSCYIDDNNVFWCIGPNGLIQIKQGIENCYPLKWSSGKVSGEYQLTFNSKQKFIFSRIDGEIYYLINGVIKPFYSKNLNPLLKDKKITRVEQDSNDCIWIYTFSGIIIYNIKLDTSNVYYDDKAFSSGIKDTENSYWLSTLHDGLLKVPDLSYKLWEIRENQSINQKIEKIVCNKERVYFATVNGKIGWLNYNTKQSKLISLNTKLDIQSIKLTEDNRSVLFGIQNDVYKIENDKSIVISQNFPPSKDILQIGNNFLLATSKGTIWFNQNEKQKAITLTNEWTRSIAYDKEKNIIWLATNDGIKVFEYKANQWEYLSTLFKGTQITSLSYLKQTSMLYSLTFDGVIYEVSTKSNSFKKLFALESNTTGYQLKTNSDFLFAATNNGLKIYNFKTHQVNSIDKLSGLISNNVHAVDVTDDYIWLATAQGIQQIPIDLNIRKIFSKIYLKRILVNNKPFNYKKELILNYKDGVKIELDAVALSSGDKFQYAYRLNKNSSWMFLPADIKKIELPFLRTGSFNLEIKLIDHLGKDSMNKIMIYGHMNPPFWQRWWFYVLIGFVCISIAFFIFKQRINIINKKQAKELQRIQLEHELKLSQETALRAQMNPHFIFNVLNSIKGYIYENDKKKAANYLQRFSDLVRKILEQSSVSWVKLDEEIELLKLYIELEAMMLSDKFDYEIELSKNIDSDNISIPSLMLQPFIENAFKHGLRHKEGEKKLNISFKTENNILIITIKDNGVGREISQKINSQTDKKHQSFSTNAIDRITTINKDQPGIVSIIYKDLINEAQQNIGTAVTINIRYHE